MFDLPTIADAVQPRSSIYEKKTYRMDCRPGGSLLPCSLTRATVESLLASYVRFPLASCLIEPDISSKRLAPMVCYTKVEF